MYLKQLELLGFKSFPNKTVVKFSEGVTAIVGPNGCGKTNVLDALRWVLGEQKPTLLRGGKMEEVIFNGTRDLKPLNMAEVTLTVINDRGVLPTEYHEVQITRRLFRNQESEYLLNKVPCRLKDITDLFVDTGMGAHSYSVIQQDMIESVISDKAEERRFLFEEAAGITKYKHRRRAALRKLESTENDFLRLKDIHAEVKTLVNSLSRQQKKAERFVQLREEAKGWEIYFSSQRLCALNEEQAKLSSECAKLNDERLAKTTSMNSLTAELESDRQALLDLGRALSSLMQEMGALSERAFEHEKELSTIATSDSHLGALIDKNTGEISATTERLNELQAQLTNVRSLLDEQQQDLTLVVNKLEAAEKAQGETDRLLLAARSSKETENQRLIELESRLSSGRTEEGGLKEQEMELARELAHLEDLSNNAMLQRQDKETTTEGLRAELETYRCKEEALNSQLSAIATELDRLLDRQNELGFESGNIASSIEACQARRTLLEDMMLHYEGYDGGIKSAMESRGRWPSLTGTVAEKFVPAAGMEVALEAALGEVAKFLICQDKATAEQIVDYLKREKKGRIGILVPGIGGLQAAVKRPELQLDEVVGWLDTFVTCEDSFKPLKEAVLSRIVVFHDGARPENILERLPYGFSAVSTTGVMYSNHSIAGGSDDRLPLFRRRERVEEQTQLISEFSKTLDGLNDEKNRVVARIAEQRAQSGKLTEELTTLQEEITSKQEILTNCNFEVRTLESECERLKKEIAAAADKLTRIQGRQYSLNLDFTQLSEQKKALIEAMNLKGSRLEEVEQAATNAAAEVARLQVAVIESKSVNQQSAAQITHLEALLGELRHTIDAKQAEIAEAQQTRVAASTRKGALEAELKDTYELRTRKSVAHEELRVNQTESTQRVSAKEKDLKRVRDERESLSETIHRLDVQIGNHEAEKKLIHERVRAELGLELEGISGERPTSTLSDEEARQNLEALRQRIRDFGPVNLLALDEYQEAQQREKFLDEQINDLTIAKNDLQQTIAKINQTAKWLFAETLTKVQANFSELFVELFSGGEAQIRLENPDDPLESNIEITARPRGKKQLPITMMSGGERALTAISLLFSLYLVKPSPFCILDEIDAPLDDANCRRFLSIIKKFSNQTQFICITHNKITMERADNLYGITMEQPGVSKLVAVRFTDVRTDGNTVHIRTANEMTDVVQSWKEPEASENEVPLPIRKRLNSALSVTSDAAEPPEG